MSKEETLDRVKREIEEGKLGIARDRLRGLMTTFPLDLSLRTLLGDINWRLGYKAEAGRWWFLDSSLSAEKQEAVAAFVKSCGNNPSRVLKQLKLRFQPDQVKDAEIRARIQSQIDACQAQGLPVPPTIRAWTPADVPLRTHAITLTCALLCLMFITLAIIGLITVSKRLLGL